MADNKVNFLRGTSTEYEASTKDNDTFYYTTDDGKLYLGNKEITNGGVTIDDILSDTSKNPVQNKVINAALNNKAELTDIPDKLPADGGNADTATALTSSAGTDHIPVRFSKGKPVAVSEILKYNTGSLPHGNTTISYASGYKYALIFAYSNQNMSEQAYLQPLTITWAGNMSATTNYDTKTITKNGPNKLTFTVTKGNIILHNDGAEYYNYLVIWSN